MTDEPERTGYVPEGGEPTNEWLKPLWESQRELDGLLEELVELVRQEREATGRMAADVRTIRAAVMGEE